MNILFVCKYNRFRSKVAEAVFNALARKMGLKKVKVKSAGVQLDIARPQVSLPAENALAKRGYTEYEKESHEVNNKLFSWADKIFIVADNVSSDGFPKEKTEVWLVPDADESELKKIERSIKIIEQKVNNLVQELRDCR